LVATPTFHLVHKAFGFMDTLDNLLIDCARRHGHICPGQVLGARMAMLGCQLLDIDDPRGRDRKKLIVWVEIDRCMSDAVSVVTGTQLGRRSLKFFDYGKVAATFLHTETGRAFRIVAYDSARTLADERYAAIAEKKERQMRAYREADFTELFKVEAVEVAYGRFDEPGRPLTRVNCARCGEGVNDGREDRLPNGEALCKPCAIGGYYRVIS
jgi:formylmethanofuran dehydrogenase subunit E